MAIRRRIRIRAKKSLAIIHSHLKPKQNLQLPIRANKNIFRFDAAAFRHEEVR
jgi:hypothetical protein